MLDYFTILTTGGIVLFHLDFIPTHSKTEANGVDNKQISPLYQTSINQLILQIFNSGKIGLKSWNTNGLKLEWILENELNLIFVAVYQNILQLTYVEELLKIVRGVFINQYREQIEIFLNPNLLKQFESDKLSQFDSQFKNILKKLEFQSSKQAKQPRKFEQTKKFQESLKGGNSEKMQLKQGSNGEADLDESVEDLAQKFKFTQGKKAPRKFQPKNKGNKDGEDPGSKKSSRTWDDGKVTKKQMELLDYSDDKHLSSHATTPNNESDEDYQDHSDNYQLNQGLYDLQEFSNYKGSTPQKSAFTNIFNTLTGQKELNNENLEPVLKQLQEHLVQKNVASEIAKQLCESVQSNLVGKKLGAFQSINTVCKEALHESLTRILSPGTSLDLLKDIQKANKQEQRPYVITFIGVNGVGKSTNLSKVCFWLLQNKKKVLIAACDTFRSGAVEQLRVHATNLLKVHQSGQVALFERGYGKDSANIAKDAIKYAKENDFDVVMVDTAGRMQNNEPLMKSLAKLVTLNQPDKVLFVGEALVGNEAVDQLKGFNQALENFSGNYQPRRIDGIILTKFDTIDDKVGAALSMTYTSGAPILFVGTGQTYTDLKRMSVEIIVNTLLN